MPTQYYPVTLTEMDTFLSVQSNGQARPESYMGSEWFYQWDITDSLKVTVWTGIPAVSQQSRPVGQDAIRVTLLGKVGCTAQYKPICKVKRVHRVKGWKVNLQSRLDSITEQATPLCPVCSGYTTQRTNRQSGELFYGCLAYPACRGTVRCAP